MSNRKATSLVLFLSRKFASSTLAICLSTEIAVLSFAVCLRAQETAVQTPSVVEAARNARLRTTNSDKHPKIITNADLGVQLPVSTPSTFALQPSSTNADALPNPLSTACANPQAERLNADLQAAQQQLDH